jgi:hypothetical protein
MGSVRGLNHQHHISGKIVPMEKRVCAGSAVGDINNDGFIDIYVLTGEHSHDILYINDGTGNFTDKTAEYGLDMSISEANCALFFDMDNDGFLDLVVSGYDNSQVKLYRNVNGQFFADVSQDCGLNSLKNAFSISAADFDKDGLADLFFTRWNQTPGFDHLYRNLGNGQFENVDEETGIVWPFEIDFSFSSAFTDIDNDGDLDILVASDFGTSHLWRQENGSFYFENNWFDDENGMGSAVGDFDNDGDLDWFVSSIFDGDGVLEGNWGASGNRLYLNNGYGSYSYTSDNNGVQNGAWGWGSAAADIDNDGDLDIIQTNGWPSGSDQFKADSTRIFLNNGIGHFSDIANEINFIDTLQGRGLTSADFDSDGDLDILITNYRGPAGLWINQLDQNTNSIVLQFTGASAQGAIEGSKIELFLNGNRQIREIYSGTNYNSQNPLDVHFGIGRSYFADSIRVIWPEGETQTYFNIRANTPLKVTRLATDYLAEEAIVVKPNPLMINSTIEVKNHHSLSTELVFHDPIGRKVFQLKPFAISNKTSYFRFTESNFSSLPSGIIIVSTVFNGRAMESIKVLKP